MNKAVLIKHINYGIASRIGNCIYINHDLKDYPRLYDALIIHEYNHSSTYKIKDIFLDLKGGYLKHHKKEYYHFIRTHPRSLWQFIPILKYSGKWSVDFTLIIFYALILIALGLLGGLYG